MLQLSGSLLNKSVLSLRTGGVIATTTEAIINPNNLKIEGFYCVDAFDRKKTLILLYQDIRDLIPQGFVVNDHDVLVTPEELVRLKDILDIRFTLIGKQLITVKKDKLGRVIDFAAEVETFYIQKLYASQSMLKSLTSGSLAIDRNQIVEITDKKIIIQDIAQPLRSPASAVA